MKLQLIKITVLLLQVFFSAYEQIIDRCSNLPAIMAYDKNGNLICVKKPSFAGKTYDIALDNKGENLIT